MIEFVFPEPEEFALIGIRSKLLYAIGDAELMRELLPKLERQAPEILKLINLNDYANSQNQGD